MAMSQLVSDNFTRTGGYPQLLSASGLWSIFPYLSASAVDANIPSAGLCEVSSTSIASGNYYSSATWAGDHYSEVTLAAETTSYSIRLEVRVQNNAGTWSGYEALIQSIGPSKGLIVRSYTNYTANTFSQIGSTVTGLTFSVGDVIRLTASGTTISVTQNGVSIFSATDSTIGPGGAPGIAFGASTPITNDQISLWAGGENAVTSGGGVQGFRNFANKKAAFSHVRPGR